MRRHVMEILAGILICLALLTVYKAAKKAAVGVHVAGAETTPRANN